MNAENSTDATKEALSKHEALLKFTEKFSEKLLTTSRTRSALSKAFDFWFDLIESPASTEREIADAQQKWIEASQNYMQAEIDFSALRRFKAINYP